MAHKPALVQNGFYDALKHLEEGTNKPSGSPIEGGDSYEPLSWQDACSLAWRGIKVFNRHILVSDDDVMQFYRAITNIFISFPYLSLIVDFGEKTAIPNRFYIPHSVKRILIRGRYVTEIGDFFLGGSRELVLVDLHGLNRLTKIGDRFLDNASKLQNIIFPDFAEETVLGSYFLMGCTRLEALHFKPMSRIRQIGDCFLHYCMGLTSINLNELKELRKIGKHGLYGCSSLEFLDLHSLTKLSHIGDGFLAGCSKLMFWIPPSRGKFSPLLKFGKRPF